MAHQVAVIGLGRFGTTLAKELYRVGHDVLVIDRQEVLTQSMAGQVTYVVAGDATSADLLEEVGMANFDTAVVAIGTDIQSSILATVLLKQQFNIKQVVARATSDVHGKTLQAVGADRVVYPEQETGIRTAHSLFQRDVMEYMELTSDFGFSKANVTPDMVGKTIEEAGFTTARDKYGAAVIAIKRGREPILTPSKDEQLQSGDVLVIGGQEGVLERVRADSR
jgi:trk system potassium uptake protein TrkA